MKLLDKILYKEWYEEFAEASPIFISLCAHSIGNKMFPTKKQYKCVLNFYSNNKTHWLTLVEDQGQIAQEILKNSLKDNKYYQRWFLKWQKESKIFQKIYKQIINANLALLKGKEFLILHRKAWAGFIHERRISQIIDPFIFGCERIMTKELLDYCEKSKIKNFSEIYAKLTSPEKESFINQYELNLIKIARKIKRNKKLLNQPDKLSKMDFIKLHLDKYRWVRCNWGFAYSYDIKDLIKEIRDLLEQDLDEIEKRKKQAIIHNRLERKKILKKYGFNKAIRALSDLTIFFSYWHDLRKENAQKFMYYEAKFLREFSRRYELDFKNLHLFDITEIEKLIKDKKWFNNEVKKRKKLFLTIHANKKVYYIFGKKARVYYDKIKNINQPEKIREIKGMPASTGKVTGKVRIIHEGKEFSKFKEREVLVTGMTRPEFIPLMKKASAIVTNDGGITCHAAIISRELGKPCVIGTRIATKVLKDGDLVEVDANRGIVTKLS